MLRRIVFALNQMYILSQDFSALSHWENRIMKNNGQTTVTKKNTENEKQAWEAPELISLEVENTEAKSKMYFNEFNVSYGAIS